MSSSLRPAVGALARVAATTTRTSPAVRQQFSTSAPARASHGSQYDPPTGWLFGVKPGEKYKPEGWENLFFYGFCGSLAVFAVAYAFKPDTSYVLPLSIPSRIRAERNEGGGSEVLSHFDDQMKR